MTSQTARIKALIMKHLKNELSAAEHAEMMLWVNASADNELVFRDLNDPQRLATDVREWMDAGRNIREKITERLGEWPAAPLTPIYRRPIVRWLAAASILALLMAGYLLFRKNSSAGDKGAGLVAATDIHPGVSKATLTLADHSVIVLDSTVEGRIGGEGDVNVTKRKDVLAYGANAGENKVDRHAGNDPTGKDAGTLPENTAFNILTTPKAGQFQLVLPDGSRVWLNNASALKYPTHFTGAVRHVELTGEAYFEIANNPSKPFTVTAGNTTVEVLGTSFNIASYSDDPITKATLVTGKIAVGKTTLRPGQQALIEHSGNIQSTQDIDVDEAISWTKGYFHFDHADIRDVLRQLARWYDVDIIFRIPTPDYRFDGDIGRDLTLAAILKHLEKKDIHFSIDGKSLIVTR